MNTTSPEAAEEPRMTRPEELRRRFHRGDRWHGRTINGYDRQLPVDRDLLLKELAAWEDEVTKAKTERDKAQKAFDRARENLNTASAKFTSYNDNADVTRLALAEALGVPQ